MIRGVRGVCTCATLTDLESGSADAHAQGDVFADLEAGAANAGFEIVTGEHPVNVLSA
jgi:hypothetical protein